MEQDAEEENEAENDALRSQNIEENRTGFVEKESTCLPKATTPSSRPPQIEEFVLVLLEDGFYIGKVEAVRSNKILLIQDPFNITFSKKCELHLVTFSV